jgi:hydroxymethylpyrimidine pyrophosphatase-like HAD family hydrolase
MVAKRKISLVLADVDGSLADEEKVLTRRAQSAVMHMRRAGIGFAITSGRPPLGMAILFDPLGLDTPIAGLNGGLFVKRDLTILEQKTVPVDVARQAIDLIRDHGLDAWVYRGNDWLITKACGPHVAREAWTVKFQPRIVADLGQQLDHVAKIVSVSAITTTCSAARQRPERPSDSARRRRGRSPTISTSPTRTRTRALSLSIRRVTWRCPSMRSPRSAINQTKC